MDEAYTHMDQDEAHVLWLALAATQAALGRLEESVRDRVLAVTSRPATSSPSGSRTNGSPCPASPGQTRASRSWPVSSLMGTMLRAHLGCTWRGRDCERASFAGGLPSCGPQTVRKKTAPPDGASRTAALREWTQP